MTTTLVRPDRTIGTLDKANGASLSWTNYLPDLCKIELGGALSYHRIFKKKPLPIPAKAGFPLIIYQEANSDALPLTYVQALATDPDTGECLEVIRDGVTVAFTDGRIFKPEDVRSIIKFCREFKARFDGGERREVTPALWQHFLQHGSFPPLEDPASSN